MIYKQSEYGYKETIIMVTFYMEISTVGHVIKPAKPRMALKRFDHVPTVIIPPSGEATNIFGLWTRLYLMLLMILTILSVTVL